MEWAVLDWNDPAIQFYKKLGAEPMTEWTVFRLTQDGIAKLAVLRIVIVLVLLLVIAVFVRQH